MSEVINWRTYAVGRQAMTSLPQVFEAACGASEIFTFVVGRAAIAVNSWASRWCVVICFEELAGPPLSAGKDNP